MDRKIKENVQKGLIFLREKYGEDWVDHITLETLQLTNASECVLGQVHPAYHDVSSDYEGYEAALFYFDIPASGRAYGFAVEDVYGAKAWDLLQEAWEEVIPDEQRRVARKRQAGLL